MDQHRKSEQFQKFRPIFAGLLAGFCNGFLGTGGGIILTLYLRRFYPEKRLAYSAAVVCVCLFSLLSAFFYFKNEAAVPEQLKYYLPSGLIGGAIGSRLAARVNAHRLDLLFAVLLVVSGATMILRAAGVF